MVGVMAELVSTGLKSAARSRATVQQDPSVPKTLDFNTRKDEFPLETCGFGV